MIVDSDYIRDAIDVKNTWLRNGQYVLPTKGALDVALARFDYSELPKIPGFNECENFSLFLHSDIKRYGVEQGLEANWAFGDFIAKKRSLLGEVVHSANICICEDEIYIIEPMYGNRIEVWDRDKYKIFFVNMN